MAQERIETERSACWVQDDIVFFVFKANTVDLDLAREAVENSTRMAGDDPYPFYYDISRIKNISKEAREYMSVPRSTENNIATAALAPNVIAKLIGTFFMTFSNPGVKIKLFTHEDEAIKWLKSMRAKWTKSK